jgi:hypothetical protein
MKQKIQIEIKDYSGDNYILDFEFEDVKCSHHHFTTTKKHKPSRIKNTKWQRKRERYIFRSCYKYYFYKVRVLTNHFFNEIGVTTNYEVLKGVSLEKMDFIISLNDNKLSEIKTKAMIFNRISKIEGILNEPDCKET